MTREFDADANFEARMKAVDYEITGIDPQTSLLVCDVEKLLDSQLSRSRALLRLDAVMAELADMRNLLVEEFNREIQSRAALQSYNRMIQAQERESSDGRCALYEEFRAVLTRLRAEGVRVAPDEIKEYTRFGGDEAVEAEGGEEP